MVDNLKLVCFDLNKTLIKENTWLDLNLAMGMTKEEDDELMRLYNESKITYEESQSMLENFYKSRGNGNKVKIVESISKYHYAKGAIEIINYLKSKGYKIALVTGSIDLLVKMVASELGIEMYSAHNKLQFDKNGNFVKIICDGDDKDFKLLQLEKFCNKENILIEQSVCVGDGDNDLRMFTKSKHGITFKGSKIEDQSWKVINNLSDLQKIL
jgi:phosphoserine phosphatase